MPFKWLVNQFRQIMIGHDNLDSVSVSKDLSHRGFDFMNVMPSDIISEIYSHLDQGDCMTCMTVCRYWYDAVPQYSHAAWRDVRLHKRIAYMDHHPYKRFLGSHVRSVVLETVKNQRAVRNRVQLNDYEVNSLIQKSLECGCINVESIEFIRCKTLDQNVLVDVLKPLASRLRRVKMMKHYSEINVPHLLYAFPELTEFSYEYDHFATRSDDASMALYCSVPSDYHTKLTYLWLNVNMSKEWKESILQRCPSLRCFIDASHIRNSTSDPVDLDLLFTWCPRLNLLESDASWYKRLRDPNDYINKDDGLQYYNTRDNYGVNQIARHLEKNQNTLRYLRISRETVGSSDWSTVIGPLRLPKLQDLISSGINFNFAALASMLNHCPALETLTLHTIHPYLAIDSPAVQSLHTLQLVRYLYLGGITMDYSLLTMLERFPSLQQLRILRSSISLSPHTYVGGLHYLTSLQMHGTSWKYDDVEDNRAAIAQFFESLTKNTKLESICLVEVPSIGGNTLQVLAHIRTLRHLDVQLDRTLPEELLPFIKALRETAIDTLKVRNVRQLSFAVLDALAELPLLSVFCITTFILGQYYTNVDKEGLQQLLSKSPNLTAVFFLSPIMVKDGITGLSQNQIHALIGQQAASYMLSRGKPGTWDVKIDGSKDDIIPRAVAIKCVDKDYSLVTSIDLHA